MSVRAIKGSTHVGLLEADSRGRSPKLVDGCDIDLVRITREELRKLHMASVLMDIIPLHF